MINKKIWFAGLFLMPLYGDLSIEQMKTMVEKIKAKRVGTTVEKQTGFVSPFVVLQKNQGKVMLENPKGTVVAFVLGGIINTKVFINQKWIKLGDKIEGYELVEIKDNSVTLRQEKKSITVFLKKSKSILQLNEG